MPLSGDGHTWIALDYRRPGEPSVVWLDADQNTELPLAADFRSFVEGLTVDDGDALFPQAAQVELAAVLPDAGDHVVAGAEVCRSRTMGAGVVDGDHPGGANLEPGQHGGRQRPGCLA
ncbi:hypothetical protein [Kutzneria kofuensis]|uniref:hypothetical protein n=1 Tax=Kutzneria kofuensis TaxID=103725 RepID=UPI003CD0A97C